jgi:5'-methylthioadenosine phosphorylase
VVREAVAAMPRERSCKCGSALAMAILTAREAIPAQTRERLKLIIGKYVGDPDPVVDYGKKVGA